MEKLHVDQWASHSTREVPFWRDDITIEEYEEERIHWLTHLAEKRMSEYKPLYKERPLVINTLREI